MKRTFGIEIEFRDAFYSDIRNAVNSLNFTHPVKCQRITKDPKQLNSNGKYWHVKYDPTVSIKENGRWLGGEVASPALLVNDKSFLEIRSCLESILEKDPVYNEDTGLHIHIDIDDIDRVKFLAIWSKYEDDIYKIFNERKNGAYTLPLYNLNSKTLHKDIMEKLAMIFIVNDNIDIFGNKNTAFRFYENKGRNFLEIRIGGMTDDIDFLIGWIKISLQLVERTREFKDTLSILYYDLPNDILDFISEKYDSLILTDSEKVSVRNRLR